MIAECEMSSIHGLLSQIPQDLPFEILLKEAQLLYEDIPPHTIQEYNLLDLFRQFIYTNEGKRKIITILKMCENSQDFTLTASGIKL